MAWTSPRTWVTGEVVTAAMMNAHVRDNLNETAPAKATTAGDMFQATAANAIARLGIGAAATLLRSSGSAAAWATLASIGLLAPVLGYPAQYSSVNGTYSKASGTNTITPAVAGSILAAWNLLETSGNGTYTKFQIDGTDSTEIFLTGNTRTHYNVKAVAAGSRNLDGYAKSDDGGGRTIANQQIFAIFIPA